jgi:hypothetical protein
MATAVKQRALGFREGLPACLTAVALHAFVCFAIFDDIALPDLSIVRLLASMRLFSPRFLSRSIL